MVNFSSHTDIFTTKPVEPLSSTLHESITSNIAFNYLIYKLISGVLLVMLGV